MKKSKIRRSRRKTRKASEPLKVEKVIDSHDTDVEEHILPLLQSIGNLKLEKIDLTTRESALRTIPMINEVLDQLSTYQRAASTLRQILEAKRDEINNN